MGDRIRLVAADRARAAVKRQADIWRTVSGWLWVAYLCGVAAALWLLL